MKAKVDRTSLPVSCTGNENKIKLHRHKSYSVCEDISSLELYEMQENAISEDNNYYDLVGDDYYYLEIEEG